jgi:rod shape determining protein RodA
MIKFDRGLFQNFDWTLFILVAIINVIGVLNIYSACLSIPSSGQSPYYIKQMQWILIGLGGMTVAFLVDYRFLVRHAYVIYGISIFLLVAVLAAGYASRGSQRWIALGSFTFQPSELMKLTLILALTKYFTAHQTDRGYRLTELVVPFGFMIVPFLMILKQPDLGTGLMLAIIFAMMVLFVGMNYRSLIVTASAVIVMLPVGWHFLRDYQRERIFTFFSPEQDPWGSGYHIIQSMIAIGSGGFTGKGYLKGSQTQLRFLPEQQTDFVFSVFAEEWGFIGAIVLLLLFLSLIVWGLNIMRHSRDYSGALISFGISMLILWETFINVGMVLGILPVVGIPLPFLSYGGSSLLVLMTAMGILMSVSVRRFLLQT